MHSVRQIIRQSIRPAAFAMLLLMTMISQTFAGEAQTASHRLKIHGSIGLNLDSHLVSYGKDIWAAGNSLRNANTGLLHPWIEFTTQTKRLSFHGGSWLDINDNSADSLTGRVQEFDLWAGYGVRVERLNVGMTLQRWRYADAREVVLDTWLTFNDFGLLIPSLALNPGLTLHSQLESPYYDKASVLVIRINPGHAIGKRALRPVWLSIPVEAGFQQNGFRGGEAGHSFTSIGARLHIPLVALPKSAGAWSLNLGATWFATNHAQIPSNPDTRFTTARIGLIHYF